KRGMCSHLVDVIDRQICVLKGLGRRRDRCHGHPTLAKPSLSGPQDLSASLTRNRARSMLTGHDQADTAVSGMCLCSVAQQTARNRWPQCRQSIVIGNSNALVLVDADNVAIIDSHLYRHKVPALKLT